MQRLRKKFGRGLAELRRKRGLTQEELAQQCGIRRSYLSGVELGKHNISLAVMNRIATALNVSMSELFKDL